MADKPLTIGFVRRGYSPSGGAEAYLGRLGRGVVDLGHNVRLITTTEWPESAWPFGKIVRLRGRSTSAFADEVEKLRLQIECDVLMSLERVWCCDIFRAGDGVHRAWLHRRKQFATPLQRLSFFFNRKHRDILRLEESLFVRRGAGRVIVNSQMVKNEIVDLYRYPADKIDIVYNGVPVNEFGFDAEGRTATRAELRIKDDEIVILFVGSGWERKGLVHALHAVEKLDNRNLRFLVAGRGNVRRYKSRYVEFLGEVDDLRSLYLAANIFVLPTLYDPFSNACLEALASGLPVITTRSNGFSEIVEDRVHGTIIDTPTWGAVAEAIVYWSDPQRQQSARARNIERAGQFDISGNVGKTLEILLQISERAAST